MKPTYKNAGCTELDFTSQGSYSKIPIPNYSQFTNGNADCPDAAPCTWLVPPPKVAEAPRTKPNSYQRPLLFASYIRTPGLKRLTINVTGMINPCHKPAQKFAGAAAVCWYFEFGPATARMFDISTPFVRSVNPVVAGSAGRVSLTSF